MIDWELIGTVNYTFNSFNIWFDYNKQRFRVSRYYKDEYRRETRYYELYQMKKMFNYVAKYKD